MNREPLYEAVAEAGFEVVVFSDHPSSFASWYVVAAHGPLKRRLVFDGRDASLSIQARVGDGDWSDVRYDRLRYHSEREVLARCKEWLIEASST